jgi:signal peptidase II
MVKFLYKKKNILNFTIILLIFFLDKISKYFVVNFFSSINEKIIKINSFLNINLISNEGIAFGLLALDKNSHYDFLTLLILLIVLILIYLMMRSNGLEKISYSMIIGGSLGNLTDRMYHRSVIDFIDIHINNLHWFIFNIADIFITLGVIILVILEITKKNVH